MNCKYISTGFKLVLMLFLATSIAMNVVLYRYANQYYMQLNKARLDPTGVFYYTPSDPPTTEANQRKTRVVFFGDSRASQWIIPEDMYQFVFFNRGISAQTSSQVAARFNAQIPLLNPDIIVLQVCINDLKTIPLYPHLKRSIIDRCKTNLSEIVEKAQAQRAAVILTTVIPVGKLPIQRRLFWSDKIDDAIFEINEYIKSLENEDVFIFDTGSVMADKNGSIPKTYYNDFLHLNKTGYQTLNKGLRGLLMAIDPIKQPDSRPN